MLGLLVASLTVILSFSDSGVVRNLRKNGALTSFLLSVAALVCVLCAVFILSVAQFSSELSLATRNWLTALLVTSIWQTFLTTAYTLNVVRQTQSA